MPLQLNGECSFCQETGRVIRTFDMRLYQGNACPKCLLGGQVDLGDKNVLEANDVLSMARSIVGYRRRRRRRMAPPEGCQVIDLAAERTRREKLRRK